MDTILEKIKSLKYLFTPEIKKWMREWKFGIALVINAVFFFLLFYADMNRTSEIGAREIIGDLSFKYNNVKRKFEHQVVWEEMHLNSSISLRDTILTEGSSNAILKLKDGTEIHLEPDSMIILDITEKNKKINFSNGSMNVYKKLSSDPSPSFFSNNDTLSIESSHGSIKVKDGDVSFAKDKSNQIKVAVSRGDAEADVHGKSYELKTNQTLHANEKEMNLLEGMVSLKNPLEQAKSLEKEKVKQFYIDNPLPANGDLSSSATVIPGQPSLDPNSSKLINNQQGSISNSTNSSLNPANKGNNLGNTIASTPITVASASNGNSNKPNNVPSNNSINVKNNSFSNSTLVPDKSSKSATATTTSITEGSTTIPQGNVNVPTVKKIRVKRGKYDALETK